MLMPLPTLRVIRPASTPATGRNYIEVNSDDEPHPTDIFATSSDDEPVAAIIANALGHRNSPVSDNSRTEPGDSPRMAFNASDNALPDTVNASKPSRGRGRGRAAKKTGGCGTRSSTWTKGGSKALAGALGSGSADNAPAPKKTSRGCQLCSQVQVTQSMQTLGQEQQENCFMILMRCWRRIWNTMGQLSLRILFLR